MAKISTRFFNDIEVHAISNDGKWWFSIIDVIKALGVDKNPDEYWKNSKII